jgi:hypothetical protein
VSLPLGGFSAWPPARRLHWELRTLAGSDPRLSRWLIRRSGYPVGPHTDIVIEGFPRTGNTYAVTAFLMVQRRPVRVAHHVHTSGQVVEAVRRGLPCVVLIREPEETVLSLLVRLPHLTLSQALRAYRRFYAGVTRCRDGFVLAPFDTVVRDVGAVVDAVNRRFGTAFDRFETTPELSRSCLRSIDQTDRAQFGSGERYERSAALPVPARQRLKSALRDRYRSPRLSDARTAALTTYQELLAATPAPMRSA